MTAEHLPDRDTLAGWLRQADHDLDQMTDRFDDALTAITTLAEHQYIERCETDTTIATLFDTVATVRRILRHDPTWGADTCRRIADAVNVSGPWETIQ